MRTATLYLLVAATIVGSSHSFRQFSSTRPFQRIRYGNVRQRRHAQPLYLSSTPNLSFSNASSDSEFSLQDVSVDDLWDASLGSLANTPYTSNMLSTAEDWQAFVSNLRSNQQPGCNVQEIAAMDPFWEQIKYEANAALETEIEAGPQLYQGILSQPSLLEAICTVISYEIQTELIPATAVKVRVS